jgi:hypothetical protein
MSIASNWLKILKISRMRAQRLLIEKANTDLQNNNTISSRDQAEFWQALKGDLGYASRQAQTLLEKQAAAALSQVIAAAQAVIAQHKARVSRK